MDLVFYFIKTDCDKAGLNLSLGPFNIDSLSYFNSKKSPSAADLKMTQLTTVGNNVHIGLPVADLPVFK